MYERFFLNLNRDIPAPREYIVEIRPRVFSQFGRNQDWRGKKNGKKIKVLGTSKRTKGVKVRNRGPPGKIWGKKF